MTKITIDKISLTGRLIDGVKDGRSPLTDYLTLLPYEVEFRHMPWNFIYQYQYFLKRQGLFIQIGRFEQTDVFRIEFNPNKVGEKELIGESVYNQDKRQVNKNSFVILQEILSFIKNPNVTRLDWAIDYEKDLSSYDIKLRNPRKTIEYKSRSQKLETLYLGSPKSDKFIRIYNKALEKRKNKANMDDEEEMEVKETLWRVESVVKDFAIKLNEVKYDYLFQNPFSEVAIYEKVETQGEGLKTSEKAMLHFLDSFPEEWDELSYNTRKKYENLKYACNYQLMDEQPTEIFEKEKNRLAEELESLLKPALDNTQSSIGTITNIHYSLEYLQWQQTGKLRPQKPLNSAEKHYLENKEEIVEAYNWVREEMNKKSDNEFEGDIIRVDSENNKSYKEWLEWVSKFDEN